MVPPWNLRYLDIGLVKLISMNCRGSFFQAYYNIKFINNIIQTPEIIVNSLKDVLGNIYRNLSCRTEYVYLNVISLRIYSPLTKRRN